MSDSIDEPLTPRRTAEFVGQAAAEAEFLECFNAGRLPHAWLITGPRGVGKATLAYRIARFVLAQGADAMASAAEGPGLFGDSLPKAKPTSLYVAPEHPVFRRIAAGGHSDFRVYERTMNERSERLRRDITVDEAREIPRFLSLTPGEGAWRVLIIDSVDDMNASSANAILKILEEPPARALLLLVSHEPGRLLPTIRSRCRKLWLGPLDETSMRTLLTQRAPDLDASDVELLVALAEGSIGRALRLAEEGGLDLFHDVQKLMRSLPRLAVAELHKLGDKAARDTSGETLRLLGELIDWVLVRIARASARIAHGDAPFAIPAGSLDRWMEVWEKTRRLFGEAEDLNLDRKQVVLETFLAIEEAAQS